VTAGASRISPLPSSALFPSLGLALALALTHAAAPAVGAEREPPDPVGLWLTQDRGGVIAVEPCGDNLCVHIAGIVLDRPSDPTPLDSRGVSQCGLRLVDGAARLKPNLWQGKILDPRDGKRYGVQLWLNPDGTLALRGYLGVSLLGRTETWTRYPGTVPADCRLSPQQIAAAAPPP
jgi:uncharacterized protein (DUF2147 family)